MGSAQRRLALGLVPLALLVGCATVWGFDNLTSDGDIDASVPDASSGDGSVDGATRDDSSARPDVSTDADLTSAGDDAADGAAPTDDADAGSPFDGGDAAAFLRCAGICAGCCDVDGICHAGNTGSQCGVSGALCNSCKSCFPGSSCCTSKGACGCQLVTCM